MGSKADSERKRQFGEGKKKEFLCGKGRRRREKGGERVEAKDMDN
jgi:hypothetical protein